jgi:hypothetical protein
MAFPLLRVINLIDLSYQRSQPVQALLTDDAGKFASAATLNSW